jgi:hypothetical protein
MSTVVFHRNFQRFQGGHLKVFHYFQHVRSSPAHTARIRFSPDSLLGPENPWSAYPDAILGAGEQVEPGALFLAGMDWRSLTEPERDAPPAPILNLIQGFRHTRPGDAAYDFLRHRAVRICVSAELEQELRGLGHVQGPIFTVPVGLDLDALPPPRPQAERAHDCVVLAVKDRAGGRALAKRLKKERVSVMLIDAPVPRAELLRAMGEARASVHLPAAVEGAYLPALESMALETPVVCPDCVGNRSFCRDGETALVPVREERTLLAATLDLLRASDEERAKLLEGGRRESMSRGLAPERARFLAILDELPAHWES